MTPSFRPAAQRADGSFTSAYSLREVASLAGLTIPTVQMRMVRGKFPRPALVVGTANFWTEDQLVELGLLRAGESPRAMDTVTSG